MFLGVHLCLQFSFSVWGQPTHPSLHPGQFLQHVPTQMNLSMPIIVCAGLVFFCFLSYFCHIHWFLCLYRGNCVVICCFPFLKCVLDWFMFVIDVMFSIEWCALQVELEASEPEWIEKCEHDKLFFTMSLLCFSLRVIELFFFVIVKLENWSMAIYCQNSLFSMFGIT